MLNLIETDIAEINYKDEEGNLHQYSVVPIVTLPKEKLEKADGKERRLERLWNNFYKNVHKELEIIEDIQLDKEADRNFSDYEEDQYAFVNYESLSALTERKRESYSIGLRYTEAKDDFTYIAKPFSKEFIEKLSISDIENVDMDIPFSHLESARDSIIKLIQAQSKENNKRLLEEDDEERRQQLRSEEEQQEENDFKDEDEEVQNEGFDENGGLSPDIDKESFVKTEDDSYKNDEENEDDFEEEEQLDAFKLQNDLYNIIDNYVPRVYLEDLNLDLDFRDEKENKHSAYSELENITIDNTLKTKNRTLERLKEERQSIIDKLYRKSSTLLYRKYTDIEKLFNFESPESEYHYDYEQIKNSYEAVLDSSESQRDEKLAELTRKFDEDMERRARNAYEQEKARIEREERYRVEEQADEFLEDLRRNAEEIFENQKNNLINDINITFESRYHGIVDEVLDEYQSDIDENVKRFYQDAEESTSYIIEKHREDMKEVQQQIQAIEKDHIQNETEFDRRVKMEVERETQSMREQNRDFERDNKSMKEELERLKRQLQMNEGTIDNLQMENRKKEERLRISESDVEHYKKQLMNHNQIGHRNGNDSSNFNQVVAPQLSNNEGVGNHEDNVVATEKVVTPLKDKLKHPLMITLFAISLGSVGLLGISTAEHNQIESENENISKVLSNIDSFKDTNEGKYLGKDTTLTIRADNRLKPSKVIKKDDDKVNVKSFDNKNYTLKN